MDIHPDYTTPQTVHSALNFSVKYPALTKEWNQTTNSVVNLAAKDEQHLLELYKQFKELTPSVLFFEPDINTYTSVALYAPENIRKKLSSLPLLRVTKMMDNMV